MSWHPTLSTIERRPDLAQNRPRPVTDAQRREDALEVIGSGDCWCGRQFDHGWPGRADGRPHPSVRQARKR